MRSVDYLCYLTRGYMAWGGLQEFFAFFESLNFQCFELRSPSSFEALDSQVLPPGPQALTSSFFSFRKRLHLV